MVKKTLIFCKKMLTSAESLYLKVYFLKLHMYVYLRAKFQVCSITLVSFRVSPPPPQNEPLKNPSRSAVGPKITLFCYSSNFDELLKKDGSYTIHNRNIQTLSIKICKFFMVFLQVYNEKHFSSSYKQSIQRQRQTS